MSSYSYTITKSFSIDTAHILEEAYTQKCCNLHGHTYTIELEVGCFILNKDGVVIDFTELKDIFDENIKKQLDHAALIPPKWHSTFKDVPGVVLVEYNPTAENIANAIFNVLKDKICRSEDAGAIKRKVELVSVTVKETGSSSAKYTEDVQILSSGLF